jgi:hypothetical protein
MVADLTGPEQCRELLPSGVRCLLYAGHPPETGHRWDTLREQMAAQVFLGDSTQEGEE